MKKKIKAKAKSRYTPQKAAMAVLALAVCSVLLAACGKSTASSTLPEIYLSPVAASLSPVIEKRLPLFRDDLEIQLHRARNPEIIAWVEVPGADIDYPVMMGIDNIFYLDHNEKKESDPYGAVFADMSNSFELTDPLVVLYGHRANNGGHFTNLQLYKQAEYFENAENRELYLYTPSVQMKYEIVAAFYTKDDNLLYEKDYSEIAVRKDFIEWMETIEDKEAKLALDNVTEDDTFIVLSTCSKDIESDRYIVVARLVDTV